MNPVLLSLMKHPDREPRLTPEDFKQSGFETYLNETPGYADATRAAIELAKLRGMDLVVADSDGYHPGAEVARLARTDFPGMVLPYRRNIGVQSWAYSLLFSAWTLQRVKDATGGLYRLSLPLMERLPALKSDDMTVHVEMLKTVQALKSPLYQYPYDAGKNEKEGSKRTVRYQWKLMGALFR